MTIRWFGRLGWVFAAVLASACGSDGGDEPAARSMDRTGNMGARYVNPDEAFPHIEFAAGIVSLNDRCPVRKNKLNTRVAPLYVNGRAVGFC